MKKLHAGLILGFVGLAVAAYAVRWVVAGWELQEQKHYDRAETQLRVSNLSNASLILYRAGNNLSDTTRVSSFDGTSAWLSPGNYFLSVRGSNRPYYIPVPLTGYRCGPDEDGSFSVTVRPLPKEFPPRLSNDLPELIYIPSGNFLLGDRLNPREPHYVWLTGFFVSPFEVTNGEFRTFLNATDGFADGSNWTDDGKHWREANTSHSSALLVPSDPDYMRFGCDDQPITWVTWYEANAFCRWMTRHVGGQHWLFTMLNEAEWEKVARGPDNLDYSLSMFISDREIPFYNWKKNPDNPTPVFGLHDTPSTYRPNRFGVYHMCGNVVEWTQSINRPYNRQQPFIDDERNLDGVSGLRVARGGSWYSASIAYLYIPYRDAFQPQHSSQDIGFRIVAKPLP